MNPQAARAALQLLERVPLRGSEADTYTAVREEIRAHAFPKPKAEAPKPDGDSSPASK